MHVKISMQATQGQLNYYQQPRFFSAISSHKLSPLINNFEDKRI